MRHPGASHCPTGRSKYRQNTLSGSAKRSCGTLLYTRAGWGACSVAYNAVSLDRRHYTLLARATKDEGAIVLRARTKGQITGLQLSCAD